jgi:glyoxylase-like metal-dependent hydrolase (beta-lactamase superfamily II)
MEGTMSLTIEILNLGSVQIDSSFLILNDPPGTKIIVPTWAYLIQGSSEGPILVDTGFRNTTIMEVIAMKAVVPPGAGLVDELARCGLRPADVRYILHTHLHLDHAGKDDIFPMETTVVVNRRELEVAAGHGTLAYPPQDTKHMIDRVYTPGAAWLLDLPASGQVAIVPGISCELAGGHTEGSMNVLVETNDGIACICGDVIYNIREQIIRPRLQLQHRGYRTTGNYDVSLAQERGAVGKVMRSGSWILPMHDQPVKVDRAEAVVGRLEGTTLPGPVADPNTPLPAVVDERHEEISVEFANAWLN